MSFPSIYNISYFDTVLFVGALSLCLHFYNEKDLSVYALSTPPQEGILTF